MVKSEMLLLHLLVFDFLLHTLKEKIHEKSKQRLKRNYVINIALRKLTTNSKTVSLTASVAMWAVFSGPISVAYALNNY